MPELLKFIGTGWSFPPAFNNATGTINMTTGEDDINASLHILLSTTIGERVMQPEYGCNLKIFLFDPLNVTMEAYIKKLVTDAITYYEPRITPGAITLEVNDGCLNITVNYIIDATNSRNNYVYPFYLHEGTNL